jgi:hypothetical protein
MPVTAWPLSLQKRGGQTKRLVNVKPHRVKVEIFRLEVAGFQLGEAVPYEYHLSRMFFDELPEEHGVWLHRKRCTLLQLV